MATTASTSTLPIAAATPAQATLWRLGRALPRADGQPHTVAVVGGGRTGQAAAALALRQGGRVTVHDDGAAEKVAAGLVLPDGVSLLDRGVSLAAGGLVPAALGAADVVVLSPGVPRAHPAVSAALAAGVPVVNELELALAVLCARGADAAQAHFDASGLCLWAITGTNGKSTATTLAGSIATAHDVSAFVGGNLGTPLCRGVLDGLAVGSVSAPRIVVLELSSYQLETLALLPVTAAAVTNLSPDHLDRYPSVDAYYDAKARLLSLVLPGGGISLNAACAESRARLFPRVPPGIRGCHFDVQAGDEGIAIAAAGLDVRLATSAPLHVRLENPRLVGHHNLQNAAVAVALALFSDVPAPVIEAGLRAWPGIAHRLERVADVGGVAYWNDTKATNVDATATALRSFSAGVHWIAGGLGKGAPYAPLFELARGRVRRLYAIGADAPALLAAAEAAAVPAEDCGTLEVAAARAHAAAAPGEHVVLSPACASFDQFRDYIDRGQQFIAHVQRLDAAAGARP